MKKFVILSIFVFHFISCNTKQSVSFDNCLIELISMEDPNFPSQFLEIHFYCQGENNEILLTNAQEFKFVYEESHYDMNYKTFLTKLLNQQIVINNDHGEAFSLDRDVTQEYQTKKFTAFLLSYFKNDGENHYVSVNKVTENERNTVFYYLFLNNYLTVFDDVIGCYYAFSTSKITKDLCKN
jgi:hypothetical protein